MRFLLLACRAHALAPTSQQHQLQYSRDGQGSYPRRSSGSRFQIYVLPMSNRPALSASGTDPRRRYSTKMQRSWKKKMIPPFGRGFSRHSGVYRPMTLFLPKINEGCQGQPRTKRLPSLTVGWKSSYSSPLPVEGEIFFLTFPFIDQAISQLCAFHSPFSAILSVTEIFCQVRNQASTNTERLTLPSSVAHCKRKDFVPCGKREAIA